MTSVYGEGGRGRICLNETGDIKTTIGQRGEGEDQKHHVERETFQMDAKKLRGQEGVDPNKSSEGATRGKENLSAVAHKKRNWN